MKSTASSATNFIPIKKSGWMFALLFLGALMFFFDHLNENPFGGGDADEGGSYRNGEYAPDFQARNLDGNLDTLKNHRGQVVILNLWATWCGPCIVEMPLFEDLYRRYRSEGLTVLAISLDKKNPDRRVRDFVDKLRLTYPVLLDDDGSVEKLYPTFSIPTTFVIDRNGAFVARVDGAKDWSSEETFKAVNYLLKGATPG